jgi:hypothetical protein
MGKIKGLGIGNMLGHQRAVVKNSPVESNGRKIGAPSALALKPVNKAV